VGQRRKSKAARLSPPVSEGAPGRCQPKGEVRHIRFAAQKRPLTGSGTLSNMLNSAAKWMGQFRLFQRKSTNRSFPSIILWWEARRIPYNLIVGLAGVLSVLSIIGNAWITDRVLGEPIGIPDPPLFAAFAALAYGVMANVCFTAGWLAELLSRNVCGSRVDAFGPAAFTIGTMFSVLLTLLPAALIITVSCFRMLVHSV
jgi:hypothetical protein